MENDDNYYRKTPLSKAARGLDSTGVYHSQFDYLFEAHSAIIGQEPKAALYKEWLDIIVNNTPPNGKDFNRVTIKAFDSLLRRRIPEEEYLEKRPTSIRAENLPKPTTSLNGTSWVEITTKAEERLTGPNLAGR